jgi:protein-tyrosine-phosphatase
MTEGFLRHFTGGRVFVRSGGVEAKSGVHPMAVRAMAEIGIDISGQVVSTLASLAPHAATYDVYVGIDDQHTAEVSDSSDESEATSLLFPAMPAHWTVAEAGYDMMRKTHIYSPRDHRTSHERSTWRFQDDLYFGEPPFPVLKPNRLRLGAAVQHEHWEVPAVTARRALESEGEHMQRFREVRATIAAKAAALLKDLEKRYETPLLVAASPTK